MMNEGMYHVRPMVPLSQDRQLEYSGFVQLIQSKHFVLRVGVGSVRRCVLVRRTKRVTT